MKKRYVSLIALCLMSFFSAQAKSFWLSFDHQTVKAAQTQRVMGSWFTLPADNSFELLRDYTDSLAFRHQVYQQYVAGVQVAGGILRVHSRDGVVTSANGYVLERAQAPQRVRRVASNGALTADGRELVLVEMADGVHYAYKHFDRFGLADVFTDADTGTELKRLPRLHTADVKTTGQSLYSGECAFTINPTADGRYALNDSTRRIYTLDAREASSNIDPYLSEDPDAEAGFGLDLRGYVLDNTHPLYNTDPHWSLLRVDSLVIDSISALHTQSEADASQYNFTTTVFYPNADGELEDHNQLKSLLTEVSHRVDLSELQIETIHAVQLRLSWCEDETLPHEVYLLPTATSEGEYPWEVKDADGTTLARGRYFVSRTAHFAIDIHWGMEQTYDFYKQTLHRDSYDGQGAPIYNVVYPLSFREDVGHLPFLAIEQENAAAMSFGGFRYMMYGFGGPHYKTVVPLDVMAHEFTHLVTGATSQLEYIGESGALNESFSDIIGITVKQKAKQMPDNWLMGDEVTTTARAMRDMANPEVLGNPGTYQGRYWGDPTNVEDDKGSVHTNSGVQNHWYYYLVSGGEYTDCQGISHSFAGIGLDRAVQIVYRNFTELLTPTAQYRDAVLGSLQAAEDLYGADSPERQAVIDAWAAVGLMSDGTSGIAATPAASPTTGAADNAIYRLDGTRVGVGSTQGLAPGIYVKNGKKIAI